MVRNAIVGQSGGPTAAINASLAGVYEGCKSSGVPTVYGMVNGIAGFLQGRVVDLGESLASDSEIELLKRTPSSFLGSCRYKLPDVTENDADYKAIFERLQELNVGYFFYIGGNDSMDTIAKLSAYAQTVKSDICFVGVPKTIDNDLVVTDHTPGYGSAAKYIATVIKETVRDSAVYTAKSLTLVEIMGRNAGWLTAAAALAQSDDCVGADMVCLPEVPLDIEAFVERIRTLQEHKPNLVVAVSEGVRLADGRYVCELSSDERAVDAFGHTMLTGAARVLESIVANRLGIKVRSIELSTLQRCASHLASLTDINEAFQVGYAAALAATAGETGKVAVLQRLSTAPYQCTTALHPVNGIANFEKTVPTAWIDAEAFQMRREFLDYARPLIQGELLPCYADGLPCHLVLKTS